MKRTDWSLPIATWRGKVLRVHFLVPLGLLMLAMPWVSSWGRPAVAAGVVAALALYVRRRSQGVVGEVVGGASERSTRVVAPPALPRLAEADAPSPMDEEAGSGGIEVITARSPGDLLRQLEGDEAPGQRAEARHLVDEIFRKSRSRKPHLPN